MQGYAHVIKEHYQQRLFVETELGIVLSMLEGAEQYKGGLPMWRYVIWPFILVTTTVCAHGRGI
jgi:hypothetical protein